MQRAKRHLHYLVPCGTFPGMDKITHTLAAVHAYSERHNILPATVVRNATGNPRLYERLKARAERTDADVKRIAEYIGLDLSDLNGLPDDFSPVTSAHGPAAAPVQGEADGAAA